MINWVARFFKKHKAMPPGLYTAEVLGVGIAGRELKFEFKIKGKKEMNDEKSKPFEVTTRGGKTYQVKARTADEAAYVVMKWDGIGRHSITSVKPVSLLARLMKF